MKIKAGLLSAMFCMVFSGNVAMASGHSPALNTLYGSDMSSCLNNLNMLKTFSQTEYTKQSDGLNDDISRATHYLIVRGQLSADMRTVMDNIYQTRLTSRCQSVHNALFDGLLNQAGGVAQAHASGALRGDQ